MDNPSAPHPIPPPKQPAQTPRAQGASPTLPEPQDSLQTGRGEQGKRNVDKIQCPYNLQPIDKGADRQSDLPPGTPKGLTASR